MERSGHQVRKPAVLLAAGLAAFTLLVSGCGASGGDKPTGVAKAPGQSNQQQNGDANGKKLSDKQIYDGLLKYAKCMRSNGVTKFPDPVRGKGLQVNGNEVGADSPTYKAADAKCKPLMPGGGNGGDNAPKDRAAALKYSKCMRSHGVPKFPDPNPNGGLNLDGGKIGMSPDDPTFKAALKACQSYLGTGNSQSG